MKTTTAGILSTGTEILQGYYPDTNSQWLSAELLTMGIVTKRHIAAPDTPECVADGIRFLVERCDIVIMTGGLGPTEDDLTRQAVCDVFGVELVHDEKAWEMIAERFRMRKSEPPRSNSVQCLVPKEARVLHNLWGTAPGFVLEDISRDVCFIAMPGPPREMRPMFDRYLRDDLAKRFGGGMMTRITTLHTFGISESLLNDYLRPLFAEIGDDPNLILAFLAKDAHVDIRMTARGVSKKELADRLRSLAGKVQRRVRKDFFFGCDEDTLESVVAQLLCKRGLTLATAESCTGGLVAKRLTDIAGSSVFFREGWVTYTNEAKHRRLGVRKKTLDRHGAVSAQTAREMALGALRESGVDVAVSLTGIAGPGGGSEEKPVGLVYYGIAWRPAVRKIEPASPIAETAEETKDACVATFCTCFPRDRALTRLYASHRALDLIRRLVNDMSLDI